MGLLTDLEERTSLLRRELKKHVATIHRSNELSLLQGKISNALLYSAYPELLDKDIHQISILQLCKLIGYSGNNHAVIKDALRALVARVVEWNVINEKTLEEVWNASSVLASVSLDGSVCRYSYSPGMKTLLYNPVMYGRINMIVQARFRSSYGLALYENCVRYRSLPKTRWFELPVFRKLMGVSEDKYPIFRDFKRRILDKAVEEVNMYSDLMVEPDLHRVGWKVMKIRFYIAERTKKVMIGAAKPKDAKVDVFCERLVKNFKLSKSRAEQLLKQHDRKYIEEKIKLISESQNFIGGTIKDVAAYLSAALKYDYQPGKSSATIVSQERRAKQVRLEQNIASQQVEEEKKRAYQKHVSNCIDALLMQIDPEKLRSIEAAFKEYASDPSNVFLFKSYKKHGMAGRLIKALYHSFIKENNPELLCTVDTFEVFVAEHQESFKE